jgi:hypothetical protein
MRTSDGDLSIVLWRQAPDRARARPAARLRAGTAPATGGWCYAPVASGTGAKCGDDSQCTTGRLMSLQI